MRNLWIITFLSVLLTIPSMGWAQIQQYRGKTVGDIDVVLLSPSTDFNAQSVKSRMKTKVGEHFSQLDFDEDLKQLSRDFDRVEPDIDLRSGQIFITLKLCPKPTINAIVFEGNKGVSSSKLQKELEIEPGTLFDRYAFSEAFRKLRSFYMKKGYFEAELSYTPVLDKTNNTVTIEVSIDEGRRGRIKKIRFIGFSKDEQREILEEIHSKKFFFATSWMSGAGTYIPEATEQDRFIVLNYLHNQGYADAKVDLKIRDRKRGSGIEIVFEAERGPRYDFGAVSFAGNTLFTDEEVEPAILAKEGDPYSPEKLQKTVEAIQDLYGSKGYIEAVINYEPKLVPGKRIYDVHFTISAGEQYRVGLVRIFGAERTQNRVILHECGLVPGEIFDSRRLKYTEQTLQNIGYFKCVNVYAVRAPNEVELGPRYRDVYIELEEDSTGSVGLSLQASTDMSFSLALDFLEKNFNYEGLTRIFRDGLGALRGGGEYLKFRAQWGFKERAYSISWTKPYFMDTCWIVGFEVDRVVNNAVAADYTILSHTLQFTATYPLSYYWRYGWQYRLKENTTQVDNKRLKGKPERRAAIKKIAKNDGVVSAVGFNIGYDSVNWNHTNGLQSLLEGELAGFFGDYRFASFAYLNAYYMPLWNCATLKLRGEGRFIQPLWGQNPNRFPQGERLFLGGAETVRGFRPFHLGPKVTASNEPLGGISSVLLSAEVMHQFHPMVSAFAFIDGGYVSTKRWRVRHLEWSVGFGFKLCLANNVPVVFGWGYPINPDRQDKNDVEHFFFSLGGRF